MRAQPAPQQRPKPFHGIHMDFTKAIAIFISGVLASSMVDTLMVVSPDTQTCINAVFICINKCTRSNGLFDERLDGLLLHIELVASFANHLNLLKYKEKRHVCAVSTPIARVGNICSDHAPSVPRPAAACHAFF